MIERPMEQAVQAVDLAELVFSRRVAALPEKRLGQSGRSDGPFAAVDVALCAFSRAIRSQRHAASNDLRSTAKDLLHRRRGEVSPTALYLRPPSGPRPQHVDADLRGRRSRRYPIYFFVKGAPYKLFGLISWDIHLFGTEEGGHIFLLGTDKAGRDLFSRIIYGGQVSMNVAIFGALASALIGSAIGAASGYYGRPL